MHFKCTIPGYGRVHTIAAGADAPPVLTENEKPQSARLPPQRQRVTVLITELDDPRIFWVQRTKA